MHLLKLNNQKGVTIVEMIVVLGIVGLIIEGVYLFINEGYKNWRYSRDQATAQDNVRIASDRIVQEIREIQNADSGAVWIESAISSSFIFYSNVDADSDIEKVRYYLSGTDFYKGVIDPVENEGQITYPQENEIINKRASYIRNTDIFTYYNAAGEAITDTDLQKTETKSVHIKFIVDYDTSKIPSAITLETDATLRNIRDNL